MKKRFALLFALLMVLALVGCQNNKPSYVEVPDLRGAEQEYAGSILKEMGLTPAIILEEVTNTDYVGRVFDQNPRGGVLVMPNAQVELIVGKAQGDSQGK